MTCKQVGQLLQSYVDNEIIDTQLLKTLESHLHTCDICNVRLRARLRLVALLKSAFEPQRGSYDVNPRNTS